MLLARKARGEGFVSSLPTLIPWSLTTSGWAIVEDGAAGTGRSFSVSGDKLRQIGRPVTPGQLYEAERQKLYQGDAYTLVSGRDYTWRGYEEQLPNSTGPNPPESHYVRLLAYTDLAGTVGETEVDRIDGSYNVSIGAFSRTVQLPAGVQSVKFCVGYSENGSNVSGVEWKDLELELD